MHDGGGVMYPRNSVGEIGRVGVLMVDNNGL